MADDLREIIAVAKRNMPDVPDEVWVRFAYFTRINFGADWAYIASQKKGRHLALLEATNEQDSEKLAQMMGVSVRRVQQLKKLK